MTEHVENDVQPEEPADSTQTHQEETQNQYIPDPAFTEVTAEFIIRKHVAYAAGSGLIPIPLFDIAAVTAVQVKMVRDLTNLYGIPFSENRFKTLVTALIGGIGSEQIGRRLLGSVLKAIPVIGPIAGGAAVPIMSGATTYAVGQVFRKHFNGGGTVLNFDPSKAKDYFKEQYNRGREKVADMTSKDTDSAPVAEPTAQAAG
ncbi:YcjF family protein [Acanthopleuribacter pedis]|uniref:DUF697 domain-containing protein n=1 Tax=Acanthopleuribacter pedis TaxID=442870 RepID=A0A8J7U6R1_9BACT|nr:DUF697 domain-containing protein [Acanthopleuribacter pedis]MBO1320646.1 DUF697 domain-containing protein [Acanthopleuribacter pedis]